MNKRQAKKRLSVKKQFDVWMATSYHDLRQLEREYYEDEVAQYRTEDRWLCTERIGNRRTKSLRKAIFYRINHTDTGIWESDKSDCYVSVYMSDGCKVMEYKWTGGSGRQKYNFELFEELVDTYKMKKVN